MSVLLSEGNDSCWVISWGIALGSDLIVSCGESDARLSAIAALALAISLLRHCNSSVVGKEVLLFGGFGCC